MFVRKTLAALASLAIAGAGMLTLASKSHAAEQIEIICRTTPPTDTFSGTGPWTFENTSANGGYCQNFRVVSLSGGLTQGDVSLLTDSTGNDVYDQDASAAFSGWTNTQEGVEVSTTASSGSITLEFRPTGSAGTSGEEYTITIGGGSGGGDGGGGDGGGGGDQSSGSSGSAGSTSSFPYITLQVLDEADGSWARALEAGLVAWEKTVPVNTWQRPPNSADVVGAVEDEGKVFLGVATAPDFPVDIAQRQVDNGWGAYDMHDDQGNLESVFIPAGGSMFVWTQPRLYAVWGAPPS